MRRRQFLIAAAMATFGIVSFYSMRSDNPITGERKSVGGITAEEEILKTASGGSGQLEFLSTHPDPGNRTAILQQEIAKRNPDGVPAELTTGRAYRAPRGGE